jgi:transglutaminase-like putative cysteine protease
MSITDPEVERYLKPTDMAQSDNPSITAEAKRIVGSETNAMLAAKLIIGAVFESLDKQAGVRGSATALEVLQNGAGDCTEHAVLVVALMRAAGIPARTVDGIVIAADGGGNGIAGYHAWAEIWLGQWIGVDATVDETGTSARYLEFGIDEPGSLGSGGKMMRSIGKTKIELGPHRIYEELR